MNYLLCNRSMKPLKSNTGLMWLCFAFLQPTQENTWFLKDIATDPRGAELDSHAPEILVVGELLFFYLLRLLPFISFQGSNCQLHLGIKVLVLGKTKQKFSLTRRLCLSFHRCIVKQLFGFCIAILHGEISTKHLPRVSTGWIPLLDYEVVFLILGY